MSALIPTVHIVGDGQQVADMFLDEKWYVSETISSADLVQFVGGHDVDPSMYGEKAHEHTWSWPNRDVFERLVYEICFKEGRAMAGICRGGQFLNVCNGGTMWQDVDGHGLSAMHGAKCEIGDDHIGVTSTHHQMMRPHKDGHVIMTAKMSSYKERIGKKGTVVKVMNDADDVEAVYYKDSGALCFQPHPEYTHVAGIELCRQRYFDYLDHYFNLRA